MHLFLNYYCYKTVHPIYRDYRGQTMLIIIVSLIKTLNKNEKNKRTLAHTSNNIWRDGRFKKILPWSVCNFCRRFMRSVKDSASILMANTSGWSNVSGASCVMDIGTWHSSQFPEELLTAIAGQCHSLFPVVLHVEFWTPMYHNFNL